MASQELGMVVRNLERAGVAGTTAMQMVGHKYGEHVSALRRHR